MKKQNVLLKLLCFAMFAVCITVATNSYGAVAHDTFTFRTHDGYTIEGQLTYEEGARRLPTVIMLTGSDAVDADMTMPPEVAPYLPEGIGLKPHKQFAEELAAMGFAVVRTGNRGCFIDQTPDMDAFHTNTITNRMRDTVRLLLKMYTFRQVDMKNLYLYGFSEGSMVSVNLMSLVPESPLFRNFVKGIVLIGPVVDNLLSIVHFQSVTAQYDQLVNVYTAQGVPPETFSNGIPQELFDLTVEIEPGVVVPLLAFPPTPGWVPPDPYFGERWESYLRVGLAPTFDHFDTNQDGFIQRDELEASLLDELFNPLVNAVMNNDEQTVLLYGEGGGSYSLAQYRDWFVTFNRPGWRPLDRIYEIPERIPIALLVGENDINTPSFQLDMLDMNRLPNVVTEIVPEEHHYGRELVNRAYFYLQSWKN